MGATKLRAIICNPFCSVLCILCTLKSVLRITVSVSRSLESASGILELLVLGPKDKRITINLEGSQDLGRQSHWKVIKSRAILQSSKNHAKRAQRHAKSWTMGPGIMRNPLVRKWFFCNTSFLKCLFYKPQTSLPIWILTRVLTSVRIAKRTASRSSFIATKPSIWNS